MSKNITLKEIETFEKEIAKSFQDLINSSTVLRNLHESVLHIAQKSVDSANTTESYDEKVDSLVKGIQGVVAVVEASRKNVDLAIDKHRSDIELINQLKSRFELNEKSQSDLPRSI
jgi:hypothetical protein